MERHRAKLLITIGLMFAALIPLGIISTVTHNYLEGTLNSTLSALTVCVDVKYGLFQSCELLCSDTSSSHNNCTGIDWDVHGDTDVSFGGNPELEMGFFFAFYGLAILVCLCYFLPFCVRIKDSFFQYAAGIFLACGVLCIVFGCVFANSILDSWELRASPQLQITIERGYSFYLHVVFSALMIVAAIVGFMLTHDYRELEMNFRANALI